MLLELAKLAEEDDDATMRGVVLDCGLGGLGLDRPDEGADGEGKAVDRRRGQGDDDGGKGHKGTDDLEHDAIPEVSCGGAGLPSPVNSV